MWIGYRCWVNGGELVSDRSLVVVDAEAGFDGFTNCVCILAVRFEDVVDATDVFFLVLVAAELRNVTL